MQSSHRCKVAAAPNLQHSRIWTRRTGRRRAHGIAVRVPQDEDAVLQLRDSLHHRREVLLLLRCREVGPEMRDAILRRRVRRQLQPIDKHRLVQLATVLQRLWLALLLRNIRPGAIFSFALHHGFAGGQCR